jgi:hypothetical protein
MGASPNRSRCRSLEGLDHLGHGVGVEPAVGEHVLQGDDHLDGLDLLGAALVTVVAVGAVPQQ